MRCSGSSLFLKTKFGIGYILTVSLLQELKLTSSSAVSANNPSVTVTVAEITKAVHGFIPTGGWEGWLVGVCLTVSKVNYSTY